MAKFIKWAAVPAVLLAGLFVAGNSAEAGWGHGHGYGSYGHSIGYGSYGHCHTNYYPVYRPVYRPHVHINYYTPSCHYGW